MAMDARARRATLLIVPAVALLLAAAGIAAVSQPGSPQESAGSTSATDRGASAAPDRGGLDAGQIAALPEARFDAVIPGLIPYAQVEVPAISYDVYSISSDTPIYDDAHAPVARFAPTDFAGRKTVIVPVRAEGAWTLVLTPARRVLPSRADGAAPAQTAGWVRQDALHRTGALSSRIVISTGAQTLSIVDAAGAVHQRFEVAVGAPDTPTPTGVTGYLQERYLDPGQGQATYPIQLTSLHATTRDEPYQGDDGGLIGMHYFSSHSGTVSHGCIRLSTEAITAVDAMPLGTSVTIVP